MGSKKRIMPRPVKPPELGTKAAALEGCVDLIARMCGKPETVVRYWLDLYFQTRLAYAVEQEQRRREAQLIERIPQVFGAPKEGAQESEKSAPAPEAQADEAPAEAKAEQEPVTEESVTPPPAEPVSELEGFEPVAAAPKKQGAPHGNTYGADAADFKRETVRRLRQMRAEGLTIAKIVRVSNGSIKEESVLDILAAKRVPIAVYRLLAAVLDKIEE